MQPIYVSKLAGIRWLYLGLVIAALVLVAIPVIGMLAGAEEAGELWLTAAFGFALFAFVGVIIPRRLEVWPQSLRLVFPLFNWDIALESVELVRETRWWEPYAFAGIRFATAPGCSVAVIRRNARMIGRPSIVVSPEDRAQFMRAMNQALGP